MRMGRDAASILPSSSTHRCFAPQHPGCTKHPWCWEIAPCLSPFHLLPSWVVVMLSHPQLQGEQIQSSSTSCTQCSSCLHCRVMWVHLFPSLALYLDEKARGGLEGLSLMLFPCGKALLSPPQPSWEVQMSPFIPELLLRALQRICSMGRGGSMSLPSLSY